MAPPKSRKGTSYKEITTSAIVTAADKAGLLYAVGLVSGTTDSSILIEDGGSGGAEVWKLSLDGTTSAGETSIGISFPTPIECNTDIFATLAGTGALAYVSFIEL